jgi:hypothetical protein
VRLGGVVSTHEHEKAREWLLSEYGLPSGMAFKRAQKKPSGAEFLTNLPEIISLEARYLMSEIG